MIAGAARYGLSSRIAISWGTRQVEAALIRTDRRVLKIEIEPDGRVIVLAPRDAEQKDVVARCQRKGGWIFRQLDQLSVEPAFTPDRRYLSGETHLLAGRPYRLEIIQSAEHFVQRNGSRLIVGIREPDNAAQCRRVLTAFYSLEARSLFPVRLTAMLPPFERRGLQRPRLIIRRMTKRWGSYTASANITLNVDLVRAGPGLIDYVIVHELAHGFHGDHSEDWQNLIASVIPDWEQRKLQLEMMLR